MTKDEIKERLQQRPFRPFKVRVAGDGEYEVPTGDHAHLHPNGRQLFVHQDTAGTVIIDVPLIASLLITETA